MAAVTDEDWQEMHNMAPPLVVWEQKSRAFGELNFTYGALYIKDRDTWYLAGNAIYYGRKREITDQEMRDLLSDDEVETWWWNKQWRKAH